MNKKVLGIAVGDNVMKAVNTQEEERTWLGDEDMRWNILSSRVSGVWSW